MFLNWLPRFQLSRFLIRSCTFTSVVRIARTVTPSERKLFFFSFTWPDLSCFMLYSSRILKAENMKGKLTEINLALNPHVGVLLAFCSMCAAISDALAYRNSIHGWRGEEYKLATVCWQEASETLRFHFNWINTDSRSSSFINTTTESERHMAACQTVNHAPACFLLSYSILLKADPSWSKQLTIAFRDLQLVEQPLEKYHGCKKAQTNTRMIIRSFIITKWWNYYSANLFDMVIRNVKRRKRIFLNHLRLCLHGNATFFIFLEKYRNPLKRRVKIK